MVLVKMMKNVAKEMGIEMLDGEEASATEPS